MHHPIFCALGATEPRRVRMAARAGFTHAIIGSQGGFWNTARAESHGLGIVVRAAGMGEETPEAWRYRNASGEVPHVRLPQPTGSQRAAWNYGASIWCDEATEATIQRMRQRIDLQVQRPPQRHPHRRIVWRRDLLLLAHECRSTPRFKTSPFASIPPPRPRARRAIPREGRPEL